MMGEGWTTTDLGHISELITSGSRGWASFYSKNGNPFLRMTNLRRERICLDLSELKFVSLPKNNSESKRTQVKLGDILVSITAELGKIGYVDFEPYSETYINQHICLVRTKRGAVETRFLAYLLSAEPQQTLFNRLNDAGAKAGLNLQTIAKFPVRLPPLPEQRKIAEILGTWDRAIELTSALLAAARTRKRGLMQILLTGKCRFPEFEGQAWREVQLGEVVSVDQQSLRSSTAPDFIFDYISLSDVESGKIVENLQRFTFEKAPSRARRIVKPGDLLVSTVRPNLQGFARVTEQHQGCIASTGFAVVTPKAKANGSYLLHYLFSHHMESQFHSLVVGSNYPVINSSDVKRFKVCLPSVAEQIKIGNLLDSCDAETLRLVTQIKALHIQKRSLMQKLLTGELRVPLDSASISMHTPMRAGG